MKKIILLLLLAAILFSKTNYSPYSWQIDINPKEIHSTIDTDIVYQIKGFQLVVWKRLSFEPYIGFPIFILRGELEKERIKKKREAKKFADEIIKIHKTIEKIK